MPITSTANRDDRSLLSPEFMRQLDRLDVLSRKILQGKMQGERRSKKRGQSIEFADYRNYVVGDDLRFVDWNLFARLDRLFLRLFMEEEDLSVNIAVDVTKSMDYGEPNKLMYARRLAAALGYIGLVNFNRVNIYRFSDTIIDQTGPMRGRRPVMRMLDYLQNSAAVDNGDGAGHLEIVCKRLALVQRRPGVVILVSDCLDKGDLPAALRYLASDRYDVYLIQVLSPQEVDPAAGQVAGDLRLHDVEDDDIAEVSVGPALIRRYKANLQAWCQYVREQALKRGIAYLFSETSVSMESLVLKYLRQRGLIG